MIFHPKCKQNSFSKRKVYALDLIFESEGFWNLEVAYLHDKICREVMTCASRARQW